MVGKLFLIRFLHASWQLFILCGFCPFHTVHGTIEAFGREASTGLGFGFEWHISDKELDEQLQYLRFLGNDRVEQKILVECEKMA